MNNKVNKDNHPIVEEAKDWPPNNKMVNFGEDIVDPLREALQIAIDKGKKIYKDGIEWTGLKQGWGSNVFHPPLALHAVSLKYADESQGRDVFTEILSIAVQLGIEQGRREVKTQLKEVSFVFSSETGKKIIKNILKDEKSN